MSALAAPEDGGEAFSFTLLSGRDAPLTARHAIASYLEGWLDDAARFTLNLLLSEVVTNAVKHGVASAACPIRVDGVMLGRWLEVEVTNLGRPLVHEAGLPADTEADGRGLALVDALSSRWGSWHDDGLTTVWFELENASGPPALREVA